MVKSCGIDFGTTNSAIAVTSAEIKPQLITLEDKSVTMPSTIFYPKNALTPIFGTDAIVNYTNGESGRFMRSLKRVLGTELMSSGTIVNGKMLSFKQILQGYIANLKSIAENQIKDLVDSVVMGRPVHFRDNDVAGDKKAQQELLEIAQSVGFKHVEFQFEPIAAAFAHENHIKGEKLACVVDVGGGTSDFSIIKIGSSLQNNKNRQDDILANSGVRIGGNDFDKDLSISSFMPEFGLGTTHGKKNLRVPSDIYYDLAEWSKINSLYTYSNLRIVNSVLTEAHDYQRYSRLLDILENETGHNLLGIVESAKISLTEKDDIIINIEYIKDKPSLNILKETFNKSIKNDIKKVTSSLNECLHQAAIKPEQIDIVILTGGSTEIPLVKQKINELFPKALISQENKLASVGLGLAFDAQRLFA